ncbi:DUF935 domain-containing protein [Plastoroseomonas hellenica]|uniref:DUF935 domain-containing protein n=1 Tax=Plastoroseomonas hellenica TaxID=2687306 RepID=UPI00201291AE|nr:DUF935 domain-containing protein [Plastoroseomonas hellenica]
MSILNQFGKPIPASEIRRLREPAATPTLAGVRPVWSGHPAEGLTPARLAMIHRAAAQGDSLRYLELAEDIEERDLHYAAVLGTRKRSVTQLPITVEAASDAPHHVEHADFLRSWIKDGVLQDGLFDMLDAIGKGYSVLEVDWQVQRGRFLPRELIYRPQRWFEVAQEDGETILLREAVGLQPLAAHKFVVHRHPSKSGLVLRSGLARVASWAWMFKSFTMKDWAIFVQNFGQPLRLGKFGPESSDADRKVLWRAVANIAGDCAAIVPKGMEIEFVEVGNLKEGGDLYLKRVDWLNREMSKLILGQTTTTDAVSGGHAVSQEHRLVQEDIERSDGRMSSTTVTRQLGRPIIDFNFGPQDAYPQILIGRPDEVPLKEVVDALYKLGPIGLTVEASEVRDRLGFSDPAKAKPRGSGAEDKKPDLIGGRQAPPPVAPPGAPGAPGQPGPEPREPAAQGQFRRLLSRHISQPESDIADAMTERLALDAQGALAGLTDQIRTEIDAATDIADLGRRLAALQLDPTELAGVLGRAMAIAHLAGQAAVLDELQGD